jgi:integrase
MVELRPRDLLAVARRMEDRGCGECSHRVLQLCSQISRYAIASQIVEVDVTSGLRGALAPVVTTDLPSITEPAAVGALMRAIDGYQGFYSVVAALRLAPLVFVRPGELRGAEWAEINLEAAEWRIPGPRMKMGIEHIVPLARQSMAILREFQQLSGHSKYVFPGIGSTEQCISDGGVNAHCACWVTRRTG